MPYRNYGMADIKVKIFGSGTVIGVAPVAAHDFYVKKRLREQYKESNRLKRIGNMVERFE